MTPAPTTVTPAPTPAPVNCKLFSEDKDTGAFDGNCVPDPVVQLWYEHKYLSVETPASNGGAPCPTVRVKKQCPPVNCVVKETGVCNVDAATGYLLKPVTRTIVTPPLYGGTACSPLTASTASCDTEYYCGPVTSPTDKAACVDAFKKSGLVSVGYFSHRSDRLGSVQISSPHIWDCINACAANSTCVAYDYYKSQVCYLEIVRGKSDTPTTATARIIRSA